MGLERTEGQAKQTETNSTQLKRKVKMVAAMERTSSMVYKETEGSMELLLYATNDGRLYDRMISPVIDSMRKKASMGSYDGEKAVDAYYRIACEAAKMYNKEFGRSFSVGDRYTAAVGMEQFYKENVFYELQKREARADGNIKEGGQVKEQKRNPRKKSRGKSR